MVSYSGMTGVVARVVRREAKKRRKGADGGDFKDHSLSEVSDAAGVVWDYEHALLADSGELLDNADETMRGRDQIGDESDEETSDKGGGFAGGGEAAAKASERRQD